MDDEIKLRRTIGKWVCQADAGRFIIIESLYLISREEYKNK